MRSNPAWPLAVFAPCTSRVSFACSPEGGLCRRDSASDALHGGGQPDVEVGEESPTDRHHERSARREQLAQKVRMPLPLPGSLFVMHQCVRGVVVRWWRAAGRAPQLCDHSARRFGPRGISQRSSIYRASWSTQCFKRVHQRDRAVRSRRRERQETLPTTSLSARCRAVCTRAGFKE